MKRVEQGSWVKVHFTGRLADGEVFDSSRGLDPIEFQVGSGQVMEGFERAILGMAKNEKKSFTLLPESAYGPRDDDAERVFRLEDLPEDFKAQAGQIVGVEIEEGRLFPALVQTLDNENITLDLNHPLAGKSLYYEVEIIEISDQPEPFA